MRVDEAKVAEQAYVVVPYRTAAQKGDRKMKHVGDVINWQMVRASLD